MAPGGAGWAGAPVGGARGGAGSLDALLESAFDFGGARGRGPGGAGGAGESRAPGLAPGVLEAGSWSGSSSWSESGTPRGEEAGAGDAWATPRGEMLPVRETAGD